jgi:hypothetical protein
MEPHGEIMEGIGILSQITVICNDAQIILDFHVFDIKSFDHMIGLPFGKFLRETQLKEN